MKGPEYFSLFEWLMHSWNWLTVAVLGVLFGGGTTVVNRRG
jgi:hypothetical protein